MSVLSSSWIRVLPLLPLALACTQEKEERPPFAGGCESNCGSSSGGGIGGSNAGGAGGAEGEGESITVNGSLVLFVDDAFDDTSTFVQQARVRIQAPDEDGAYLGANYDGTEFSVAGALKSSGSWVYVETNSDQSDFWSTLTRQDTREGLIEAPVVGRVSLLEVFDSQSKTPTSNLAQLVVRVVDGSGKGVEGVTLTVPGADFITYRDLGVWTGLPEATTEEGLAFAGNVVAGVFPGYVPEISLGGTVKRLVTPVIASGAVTLITVVVNP